MIILLHWAVCLSFVNVAKAINYDFFVFGRCYSYCPRFVPWILQDLHLSINWFHSHQFYLHYLHQVFPDHQALCTTSTLTASMVQSLQLYEVGSSHWRRRRRYGRPYQQSPMTFIWLLLDHTQVTNTNTNRTQKIFVIILTLLGVALLFVCCMIHCKRLRLSDENKLTYLLTYKCPVTVYWKYPLCYYIR